MLTEILGQESQSLWVVLKASLSQHLDYHCSLSYPSDIKEAARNLDDELWWVLEKIAGFHIPRSDEGLGWECVSRAPVYNIQGVSFQDQIIRAPVKRGGFGLRSIEETCYPAFVGSVQMAIPFLVGSNGICPQLSVVIGDNLL